jgi:hypothetical protein
MWVWEFTGELLEGSTYLFLVVQALVVIFKDGLAFCCAAVVFGRCVGYVACEDFLPEGEAAGWACEVGELVIVRGTELVHI